MSDEELETGLQKAGISRAKRHLFLFLRARLLSDLGWRNHLELHKETDRRNRCQRDADKSAVLSNLHGGTLVSDLPRRDLVFSRDATAV
jgi:hypothetical protein